MLIDKVVEYCNDKYSSEDLSCMCEDCNHHDCPGSCKGCLEQIHYPHRVPNGKKDYDCPNLVDFYVCDYTFKYASEILYLLRKSEAISSIQKYHIMSMGCGACPDLMAFERYVKETDENKTISYIGVDKNKLWKPVHTLINSYRNDIVKKTRFIYEDAIEFFDENMINSTNVLVLQYVISHFYNTGQINEIDDFFDNLIKSIVYHKDNGIPFVIIINDVNSNNRGRDFFVDFCSKLSDSELHVTYQKYYFDYYIQNDYQRYGERHDSNRILFEIPDGFEQYEPWTRCSSAQLIIEVE